MELLTPHFGLVFLAVLFSWFILWLLALIDISRNRFKVQNEKLYWGILILFVPLLGSILYFLIGRKHKVKTNQF